VRWAGRERGAWPDCTCYAEKGRETAGVRGGRQQVGHRCCLQHSVVLQAAPPSAELHFVPNTLRAVPAGKYELIGVLTHKGRSADSGHYVSWVRQEDGQWVQFDDDKMILRKEEEVLTLSGGWGGCMGGVGHHGAEWDEGGDEGGSPAAGLGACDGRRKVQGRQRERGSGQRPAVRCSAPQLLDHSTLPLTNPQPGLTCLLGSTSRRRRRLAHGLPAAVPRAARAQARHGGLKNNVQLQLRPSLQAACVRPAWQQPASHLAAEQVCWAANGRRRHQLSSQPASRACGHLLLGCAASCLFL